MRYSNKLKESMDLNIAPAQFKGLVDRARV